MIFFDLILILVMIKNMIITMIIAVCLTLRARLNEIEGAGDWRRGPRDAERLEKCSLRFVCIFCIFVFLVVVYFVFFIFVVFCMCSEEEIHTPLREVAQLIFWGWYWCWGLQKLLGVCRFERQTKLYNYQMLPTRRNGSSWKGFAAKYSAGLVLTMAEQLFVLKHGLLSCNWSSSAAREQLSSKMIITAL